MADSAKGREESASSGRVCLLVLGMHRSGTSALSRIASLLGADLPEKSIAADGNNEAGYWEPLAINSLDNELLASAGSRWDDWLAFDRGWYASPRAGEFKARALAALTAEYGASSFFILKDPRICRLAPFWLDVLETVGIQPLLLLPLRNPLEVAASLEKRDGMSPELGHLLWLRHVLEAEAASRGRPRLHCSYDELMTDWPRLAARAREALNLSWPRAPERAAPEIDAFLAEGLRHHREAPQRVAENPALSAWLRDTFDIFSRWAREGENPADFPALDRIRAAFDDAAPAFVSLVAQGREDARRARAAEQAEANAQTALNELAEQQAARQRAEAEREAARAEAAAEKAGRQKAEAERGAARAAEQAEANAQTALAELAEQQAARERAEAEREAARAEAAAEKAGRSKAEAEREAARAEAAAEKAGRSQAEAEREAARAEAAAEKAGRSKAEAALAARIEEIVTLTRLMRAREAGARARGTVKALLGQQGLRLLPRALRIRQQMAWLRRSGIFDAEWYARTYPDVAAAGIDPLRHFVQYGAAEGRAPNAAAAGASEASGTQAQ